MFCFSCNPNPSLEPNPSPQTVASFYEHLYTISDMATPKYTAQQIQVLEGLEPVRKRPGMYIGSTDQRGLHHLVYEIVDNSIDEAMAGFWTRGYVRINEDGSVTVQG